VYYASQQPAKSIYFDSRRRELRFGSAIVAASDNADKLKQMENYETLNDED